MQILRLITEQYVNSIYYDLMYFIIILVIYIFCVMDKGKLTKCIFIVALLVRTRRYKTLPLKKFKIGKIEKSNNSYLLYIKTLDLEIHSHDVRIYNIRPFKIEINEHLEICNNTDQVIVSIDSLSKRTIKIQSITIQELSTYFDFQSEIEYFVAKNKSKLKPTDPKLSAYLQEIEAAILLDELLTMHRENALNTNNQSALNEMVDSVRS